jgi:tetratricopeptide (TPR) repeat protein
MARRYQVDLRVTRLLLQIGVMCAQQGKLEEAVRIIRSVKAFRPDLPHPGTSLALTLLYQGRLQEAQRELEGVLATFPAHQLAKALLGLVHREAGRGDWQRVLQEVIDDGRDEWAIGLARACLAGDSPPQVSASPVADEHAHIPHCQRLYA